MTPNTLVRDAKFNLRARTVISRLLAHLTQPLTLADVAQLSVATLLKQRNIGEGTVNSISYVLAQADLYLADDTPDLWTNQRGSMTRVFQAKAKHDLENVIRILCNAMPTRELVALASREGWSLHVEEDNGEAKDYKGRIQDSEGQAQQAGGE